jgi:hypothetical protein
MAGTQPDLLGDDPNGRASGLSLNLSSNNPFRNRAASPSSLSPTPHSPFDDPPPRPTSNNPFLDPSPNMSAQRTLSPDNGVAAKRTTSPTAEELFDNLLIDDGSGKKPLPRPDGSKAPVGRPGGPPRGENVPPRNRGPPSSHRPTRSQEEALKARRLQAGPKGNVDSPQKRSERRPRRNSESSLLDIEKPLTEEEKKAREKRRERERERRPKDKSRQTRRIDLIDQLDATGIYGSGLFHHDGPFDACNPERNRKGSRRAPMYAFAKDSANNSLGGSGPINRRPDHATFMGNHDDEAFKDYAKGARDNIPAVQMREKGEAAVFDPKSRAHILHGDESLGLGTSTFLEGTPATRTAIQRREAETAQEVMQQGLARKKSLAQRFRSINRGPNGAGRGVNADGMRSPRYGDMASSNSTGERNPFFQEFDKTEERISVKRTETNPLVPTTSLDNADPAPGLERRATTDATAPGSPDATRPQGSGFIARVKSLKGGRRQRPEPPQAPQHAPPTAPGTAV